MTIQKSSTLYVALLTVWAMLMVVTLPVFVQSIHPSQPHNLSPVLTGALVVNAAFIAYFWLNGIKDIVYVCYFYLLRRQLTRVSRQAKRYSLRKEPRVVMLYCTANDFSEISLLRAMRQKYGNYKIVILDDSSKPEYIERVDAFARKYKLRVVRRKDRIGFKAGNLNHYLRGRKDYDYFVILDSDEIVPPTFITSALKYFRCFENVGIVQANHVATRNRNRFMALFARGVNSHWPTYQLTKHHSGFMSLLGHGAMVSRECYEAAGGFPHLVAEDLCFSIEARIHGYYVAFAQNIRCQEEYPVDYLAFKKRHSKWTQGNMEFIKTYTRRILLSHMTWYEKLDIFLFTYNLPLTAVFASYVVINVVALPALGYHLHYPAWLLAPTLICLFAPVVNDVIYHVRKMNPLHLAFYLLHTFMLYGSMFFISLYTSALSILGAKAKFIVTPKTGGHVSLGHALIENYREITFAAVLLVVSADLDRSVLPVLLIAIPSFLSVYLARMSNKARGSRRSALPQLFSRSLIQGAARLSSWLF